MLPAQKEKEKYIKKCIEEMAGKSERQKYHYLREKKFKLVQIYKLFGSTIKKCRPITLNTLKYWEKLRKKGLLIPTNDKILAKKKKKTVLVKVKKEIIAKPPPTISQPHDVVVIDPTNGQPEHVIKFLKSHREIPQEIVMLESFVPVQDTRRQHS